MFFGKIFKFLSYIDPRFSILFYKLFKNMKAILTLLFVLIAVSAGLVNLSTECPAQYVPNPSSICIRPTFIPGCQIYKSEDQCFSCSSGTKSTHEDYELIEGKCSVKGDQVGTPGLVGCLAQDGGKCTNCANGFRQNQGECVEGVHFCQEYDEESHCAKCQKEYSLIFGECRHNQLLGCKLEQADHSCLECYKPYSLQNYRCVIPNCKIYNDYGCVACECGFFTTDNRNCQKMQTGCLKYYRGTCVECLPHFQLKGGVCAIDGCLQHQDGLCSSCKEDYDLIDGSCKFKNCLDWQNDTCLICESGFNLLSGKCTPQGQKFVCSG